MMDIFRHAKSKLICLIPIKRQTNAPQKMKKKPISSHFFYLHPVLVNVCSPGRVMEINSRCKWKMRLTTRHHQTGVMATQ